MRKVLSKRMLAEYGWRYLHEGSVIVSYCETCGQQRTHRCSGVNNGNPDLLRFDCQVCLERLNGGAKAVEAIVSF